MIYCTHSFICSEVKKKGMLDCGTNSGSVVKRGRPVMSDQEVRRFQHSRPGPGKGSSIASETGEIVEPILTT